MDGGILGTLILFIIMFIAGIVLSVICLRSAKAGASGGKVAGLALAGLLLTVIPLYFVVSGLILLIAVAALAFFYGICVGMTLRKG